MKTVKRVISRFFKERFFDQAAQTAYYLLLSMLPFLIFLFSLLSFFTVNEEVLLNFLEPFTPVEAFLLIEKNLHVILNKNQGNVVYMSLAGAFWLSSMAVQSLARSLDLANGHKRQYPFWQVLIRDLGITLLFMLVIPLSLFLPIIDEALHRMMTHADSVHAWHSWLYIRPAIRWGMGSLFLLAFFLLFYKIVPTGKMAIKTVLPGALFTTIGWQLFSLSFGKYVSNVDYTLLYGQLSGIILLVLWFYSTAIIILLSGLLNAEFRRSSRKRRR
ncbi:YihY/virulence factor BrkB family protein [Sporosarcina pasteurii]|uniref:YihY family inner membrane protein n=1 Tax=Sporosarcina pasteurii TaxID=1474 RepID=A0A380BDF1_SPOPA|nr:YihY/virulence factor BrkB family protein [Sporosarcina pasteurii]MDS9472946.1 YihY/virulence factor BrkB family protein [Sporosarcina pasteurii]QBQ06486.1 YihY/virulence factor BrkB family protein [Sporosarcina pasteurii]SUI98346.1 YihY family inner membrane protein [Sporosarcina pasteurii]